MKEFKFKETTKYKLKILGNIFNSLSSLCISVLCILYPERVENWLIIIFGCLLFLNTITYLQKSYIEYLKLKNYNLSKNNENKNNSTIL